MKLIKRLMGAIAGLDTIEKKSFWTVSPAIVLNGIVSLLSASATYNTSLIIFAAGLCVVFPVLMMLICYKTQEYHFCYPTLCIGLGAICVPITFLANGGFHSGMPIICTAAVIVCAFVYDLKWRMVSFFISFAMNIFMFYISKAGFGTLYAVNSNWVENDIILCFVIISISMFVAINMLLTEVRTYVTDSEVLQKVMDEGVHKELIRQANNGTINERGSQTSMTVLFVDISRFTSTSELMKPEDAAEYLNMFLVIADNCIHNNGGILDKFIGDCAMAYWPDPNHSGAGALSAVRTVFDMRDTLYGLEEKIFERFGFEMDFSAGIDYGDTVLGNIGSDARKEYTIIGDAVNTASRIQGIASRGELLVSDHVVRMIGQNLELTPITETYYLRGKNIPLVLYRVNSIARYTHEKRVGWQSAVQAKEPYKIHVCGCRGSFPVSGLRYAEFGGETSCYVLKKGKYAVVIDCGSGLGNSREILSDCEKIDILLTHVHYDHIMGFLNMSVFPKGVPLTIYGHFGGWSGMDTIYSFLDSPYWPVNLVNVENVDIMVGLEYQLGENISACFYRADHPNNGTVIRLNVNGKKVCIYADMEEPSYLDPEIAMNADILFYDGMFDDEDKKLHEGWGHSTWQEAARYAEAEKVKRLVVTHHNPANADHALMEREDKAKKIFASTIFARTGDIYIVG